MIRETSELRINRPSQAARVDGPALRLPSHHFNAKSDEDVLRYLDSAQIRLEDRNSTNQVIGETMREIYAALHARRSESDPQEWQRFVNLARRHPIIDVLHQDSFTHRAFSKPRGYAGDAGLLDQMYATEHGWSAPEMSWKGQRIHRWTTHCSACEGVKARREVIADTIDLIASKRRDAEVMSLAAGHLREAEFSSAVIRNRLKRLVAIDSDDQSLAVVDRDYCRFGVQTIHANARELISGRLDVGMFDLIYTSGLCDYLSDSMCQRLAENLFNKLKPGGQLLLTNFAPQIEAIGYMEVFMDWNLIYRNRLQMMEMSARIPDRMIDKVTCFTEENHNVIFLSIDRAG